jgi:hypothetical protein
MLKQTPKCCGRTMRRDGRHLVCSKCKGWLDAGLALLTALIVVGVR